MIQRRLLQVPARQSAALDRSGNRSGASAPSRERPPKLTNLQRKLLCELYERDLTVAGVEEVLRLEKGIHAAPFMAPLIRKGLVKKVGNVWRAK